MADRDTRVAIIGGGIAGLTTATLLQVNGYRTVLFAMDKPSDDPDIARPPEFATLHAAASILPHSVLSPKIAEWTSISQEYFRALSFRASCGVRSQVHYEIFESDPVPPPSYAEAVDNFELLEGTATNSTWVPRRTGASQISGWKFDLFFCEVPEYVRHLYALYEAIGGRIVPASELPGQRTLVDYLTLNFRYYINCTGASAYPILKAAGDDGHIVDHPDETRFEPLVDPFPPRLIRGHYLKVDLKEMITGDQDRFFSYNYKPSPDIYQTVHGEPADVYCYPRSDAWILGGSRQEGRHAEDGTWEWQETVGPTQTFDRIDGTSLAIPSPILNLNSDILLRITQGRLNLAQLVAHDPSIASPGVGYRLVRDSPSDSVRLACSRVTFDGEDRYIFHNYGHGGSGFTLSWGCAFDLLTVLDRLSGRDPQRHASAERRKFTVMHSATRVILLELTGRLLERTSRA